MINEKKIQAALIQFKEGKEDDLLLAFDELVKNVANYRKMVICDSVVTDTIDLCLEKTSKYQASPKCKAFDYFTTIIGCYLSQIKRMQMNAKARSLLQ